MKIARLCFALACAASCAFIGHARAQSWVHIPLPSLAGHYPLPPEEGERTAMVVLPAIPTSIESVALRVRGTTEVGLLDCGVDTFPWPTGSDGTFGTSIFEMWRASGVNGDVGGSVHAGPFEWTIGFRPSNENTTWAMLMDGEELLHFSASWMGFPAVCTPLTTSPACEIEEVTVLVHGTFPVASVPLDRSLSTWGRVKAGYR